MDAYLKQDDWLSLILEKKAYHLILPDSGTSLREVQSLLSSIKGKPCFCDVKINVQQGELITPLILDGFKLIECAVSLVWKNPQKNLPASQLKIMDAKEEQAQDCSKMACETFIHSRFFKDNLIPKNCARKIKSEWAGNLVRGIRGDHCWVALVNERVGGFLGSLVDHEQKKVLIDLIAVAGEFQNRGIGTTLVQTFVKKYQSTGYKIGLGTQLHNMASLNLYQKTGFGFEKADYVLHGHF